MASDHETIFTMEATPVKYGAGASADTVRSVRKLHRLAQRSNATVVTGHDPDAWPTFKHVPEAYD